MKAVSDSDQLATDVAWDLEPLLGETGSVDSLLAEAAEAAEKFSEKYRGRIAYLSASDLAEAMHALAQISDGVGRVGSYVGLKFSVDTTNPEFGAQMANADEKSTAISNTLLFVELEWAAADDAHVEEILTQPELDFCRHHLSAARRYRPHLLSEPEEKILADKAVTGSSAWGRLFSELTSAIEVDISGETISLEEGLSRLQSPERPVRKEAALAVTCALEPGLRTRAFIFNTLLADKGSDDRLRHFDNWLASRNLDNEASDESVAALVEAVVSRYDIPQRWYTLKAKLLGLDRIFDYDRMALVSDTEETFSWSAAREIVSDAYKSFSPELSDVVERFFNEKWIDAPQRPGKRSGAFCAYTVPDHHPYLLLNWTGRRRDVLT
ncbi:MAG: oligoendopeptidase, partial [Actinobacteria bacterium]|nr:oligoendopeptidase [Actinomycetota bacterium]